MPQGYAGHAGRADAASRFRLRRSARAMRRRHALPQLPQPCRHAAMIRADVIDAAPLRRATPLRRRKDAADLRRAVRRHEPPGHDAEAPERAIAPASERHAAASVLPDYAGYAEAATPRCRQRCRPARCRHADAERNTLSADDAAAAS